MRIHCYLIYQLVLAPPLLTPQSPSISHLYYLKIRFYLIVLQHPHYWEWMQNSYLASLHFLFSVIFLHPTEQKTHWFFYRLPTSNTNSYLPWFTCILLTMFGVNFYLLKGFVSNNLLKICHLTMCFNLLYYSLYYSNTFCDSMIVSLSNLSPELKDGNFLAHD